MQDIVRSLANMENELVEIGNKVEILRSQIRSLSESTRQSSRSSVQSAHPSSQKEASKQAERSQRKVPYGSSYRQDGWNSRTAVSSTQEGIQESWLVGDDSQSINTIVMKNDSSSLSGQSYARQSEYSIYARP